MDSFEIITTPEGTCAFRYVSYVPVTLATQLLVSRRLETTRYSLTGTFYHGEREHHPHNHYMDDYCGTNVPSSKKEMLAKLLNNNTYF